jgi:hypothetical protein
MILRGSISKLARRRDQRLLDQGRIDDALAERGADMGRGLLRRSSREQVGGACTRPLTSFCTASAFFVDEGARRGDDRARLAGEQHPRRRRPA